VLDGVPPGGYPVVVLPPPEIILASGSPRRRELLARAGLAYEAEAADIPEEARPGETPRALVERLAQEKAAAVRERHPALPSRIVLGADTIVVIDDEILGKPRDAAHARALLTRLLGRTHSVLTGVAAILTGPGSARTLCVESRVTMRDATPEEVRAYVASGEPLDKAGAYALQGEGRRFVRSVEGSETNVIGLPMEETLALVERARRGAG